MSQACLIGLTAETPVHVGIGQAAEALDLPVAREAITQFPHVPGSGSKGGFRVWGLWGCETVGLSSSEIKAWFGHATGGDPGDDGAAGCLLFGEARLAALPVRATTSAFVWVTSPLILNRLSRDLTRINALQNPLPKPVVSAGHYLGPSNLGNPLGLEEREFKHAGQFDRQYLETISKLCPALSIEDRLVILSDDDMTWFAKFGLPVAMRNKLDSNKQVENGALWSEETMASETILSMIVAQRQDKTNTGALDLFQKKVKAHPYIQLGGNETIGQGWFSMEVFGGKTGG